MHEIFYPNLILNSGKFKIPLYSKAHTPLMLMQTGLTPISESNLYVRICYPHDEYLDTDTMIFVE